MIFPIFREDIHSDWFKYPKMCLISIISVFIDFFNFAPYKSRKDKNASTEIFYALSRNENG